MNLLSVVFQLSTTWHDCVTSHSLAHVTHDTCVRTTSYDPGSCSLRGLWTSGSSCIRFRENRAFLPFSQVFTTCKTPPVMHQKVEQDTIFSSLWNVASVSVKTCNERTKIEWIVHKSFRHVVLFSNQSVLFCRKNLYCKIFPKLNTKEHWHGFKNATIVLRWVVAARKSSRP